MRQNTFQSFADSVVTNMDLSSVSIPIDTLSKDDLYQRYPASTGIIKIMKPKINRVDKIATPSFIEDVFNDNHRLEYCLEMDIPDELIVCLIHELYGIDTPEEVNSKQMSIIKVLAVYIIISTYTA